MGTSAFDIIGGGKNSKGVVNSAPQSAFDIVKPKEIQPTEPDSFSTQLGNSAAFMGSLLKSGIETAGSGNVGMAQTIVKNAPSYISSAAQGVKQGVKNLDKTLVDTADDTRDAFTYYSNTPISQIKSDALGAIKSKFQESPGVGSLISAIPGMALGMAQDFAEAASQKKNENGLAVPMSPEEIAQKYQSVAGTLIMGKVAKGISSSLLPTEFLTQEAALAAQKASRVGKLAKIIGTDVAAGAGGGFAQGAVSGLGSENDLGNALEGALTFAPIGAAFGLFGLKRYNEAVNKEVGRTIQKETGEASRNLAALNSLRANDGTTMQDLASNIDAINSSDNLVNAAIKAKLDVGKGYVVENFVRGDELPDLPGAFAYHSPANNSLLASPYKLNSETQAFFSKTGFMPREIVNFGGNDNYIVGTEDSGRLKIKDVNTGQETVAPSEAIRRTNDSINTTYSKSSVDSEGLNKKLFSLQEMASKTEAGPRLDAINKSIESIQGELKSKPETVGRIGLLSSDNYLEKVANSFADFYKKDTGKESFDNLVAKYAQKFGIASKDIPYLSTAIYKRVASDLSDTVLSPKEQAVRMRLRNELEQSNKDYTSNLAKSVFVAARSNNMIISTDGQGRYDVKFSDGTPYATVSSPEDALKVINTSGQVSGNPLDGGGSGAVPTNLGNLGGMSQPFDIHYGKVAQWADRARLGAIGSKLTPAPRWLTLFDNVTGSTQLLQDVVMPIQQMLADRKNFQIKADPITTQLNKVLALGKHLSEPDLLKVGDNVRTLSAEEIKSSILSRPMLSTEISAANKWFKGVSTKEVSDLLYSAKSLSKLEFGTAELDKALAEIGKESGYSKKAIKAAQQINLAAQTFTPDLFSPYAVMKLAKALEDPSTALTRDQHAAKHNLTPLQKNLADNYAKLFDMYDIDPKQKIRGGVPDIPIYNAVSGKGIDINPIFGSEIGKIGVTPENNMIANPASLAIKNHFSYINTSSGFYEGMDAVKKNAAKNLDILSQHADPDIASLAKPLRGKLDTYFKEVSGHPSEDEILSRISSKLTEKLGFRSPDIGSVLNLFSISNLALRPGLAVRDVHNAIGAAYILYGHEFAEKAFTQGLSKDVMRDLQNRGVFPRQDAQSIIDPFKAQNLFSEQGPIGQTASWAFKTSGQEEAYNRTAAGIYMATRELGAKVLRDLQSDKIDKAEAYKQLRLSSNGPAIQRAFDGLVSAGKGEEAVDLLGRWNIRTISTLFGSGNAPIGWANPWGRLLGQYGNWSVNASNTLLERMTYGSKEEIAGRVLRSGIVYGATAAAGAALGLNLHSWQFMNPMEVLPGVGPLATVMKDASRTFGKDQNALDAAMTTVGGIAGDFVPFKKAADNWITAYNTGNPFVGILNAPPAK